ncbi:apelin-like [Puntigrus tetrazona]|uniref:apelin-like n=1 Tax=Puntigrus tetrazona TaxID=1606681 RepID=UPI001C8AC87E|nr:apelin-like [Puntigrus tetrazona]
MESAEKPTEEAELLALSREKVLGGSVCRKLAGPMASTEHSKELEEVGSMRTPLRQNSARAGRSQRPSGWRRRRPRPRLSHKGPMPF